MSRKRKAVISDSESDDSRHTLMNVSGRISPCNSSSSSGGPLSDLLINKKTGMVDATEMLDEELNSASEMQLKNSTAASGQSPGQTITGSHRDIPTETNGTKLKTLVVVLEDCSRILGAKNTTIKAEALRDADNKFVMKPVKRAASLLSTSNPENRCCDDQDSSSSSSEAITAPDLSDYASERSFPDPSADRSRGKNKENGTKQQKADIEESRNLRRLKKICKAAGISFVRFNEGCSSDKDIQDRLKKLLRERGMTGTPSLEKATALRLKKEAAELDLRNIIQTNTVGRTRRHGEKEEARKIDTPKTCNLFSRITDIIDSDASDS